MTTHGQAKLNIQLTDAPEVFLTDRQNGQQPDHLFFLCRDHHRCQPAYSLGFEAGTVGATAFIRIGLWGRAGLERRAAL